MERDVCKALVNELREVLLTLATNPYPEVPNPPGCKRRASVACILRLSPNPRAETAITAATNTWSTNQERIRSYFSNSWIQDADPEILFIRRAARHGDRWTSQVALPGGKRDLDDASDQATSIRETLEEVGLDLQEASVIQAGNLPQRIITTEWGTVPLMVLCPFVYLVTDRKSISLKLQPDEIASAHWVPIRVLMEPSLRTYETANTSDRFAKRRGTVLRLTMRFLLGQMLFGATKLVPSESIYSTSTHEFLPPSQTWNLSRVMKQASELLFGQASTTVATEKPLLLWGLTHGIILDLLRLMPSSNVLALWRWPTFSAPDIRFMVWLVSWRFRQDKLRNISLSANGPHVIIEEGFASKPLPGSPGSAGQPGRPGIQSISNHNPEHKTERSSSQYSAVHNMLDGYYDLIQRGIWLGMVLRVGIVLTVIAFAGRKVAKAH